MHMKQLEFVVEDYRKFLVKIVVFLWWLQMAPYTEFIKPGASIDLRHFRTGQKKYFKYSFVFS